MYIFVPILIPFCSWENLPKLLSAYNGEHKSVIHADSYQFSIGYHHILNLVLVAGSCEPIILPCTSIPIV